MRLEDLVEEWLSKAERAAGVARDNDCVDSGAGPDKMAAVYLDRAVELDRLLSVNRRAAVEYARHKSGRWNVE